MEKAWYEETMKEQILEGYKVIEKNIRTTKEKINRIIRNGEEGYEKKIKEQEHEIYKGRRYYSKNKRTTKNT